MKRIKEKFFSQFLLSLILLLILLLNPEHIISKQGKTIPPNWPWRGIVIVSSSTTNPEDIKTLAEMKANCISINIKSRLNARRKKISGMQAFKLDLDWTSKILDACKKYGLTAIITFGEVPVEPGLGLKQNSPGFWSNKKLLNEAINQSGLIAKRFNKRGNELAAYKILSEPAIISKGKASAPSNWNHIQEKIIKEIRKFDRSRFIVATPAPGGIPGSYRNFKPLNSPKIIYNCHFYAPNIYTHQGLTRNKKPYGYPGLINLSYFDKKKLKEIMEPVVVFSKKNRALIYIGEFSAVNWAKGSNQYVKDIIDLFEINKFSWTYFCYNCFHGWDPDYTHHGKKKKFIGKKSKRWHFLKKAFLKN